MDDMADKWITDWEPSTRFVHYTRSNVGEVSPDPSTPLGWTFAWEGAFAPGWADGTIGTGAVFPHEVEGEHPPVLGHFGGRLYINLSASRMQAVRSDRMTVKDFDRAFFGSHPDVPEYVPHPDDDQPELTKKMNEHMARIMTLSEWPGLAEERAKIDAIRANRPDFSSLSNQELVDHARTLLPPMRTMFGLHVLLTFAGAVPMAVLGAVGDAIGDPSIAMRVLGHVGDVDSEAHNIELWEMSRFLRSSPVLTDAFDRGTDDLLVRLRASDSPDAEAFLRRLDAFLFDFGSRGTNEWELASESWEIAPTLVLKYLVSLRRQPDDSAVSGRKAESEANRDETLAAVRAQLQSSPELLAQFELGVATSRIIAWRERTKTSGTKVTNEARVVFRELGRRAVADGHLDDWRLIYMLLASELDDFASDPAKFEATLKKRKAGYDELFDLEPPFIIANGNVPPLSQWKRKSDSTSTPTGTSQRVTQMVGTPGSSGVVTGTARVLHDPYEADHLEPGGIIVARVTDPAWTPLFMLAGGVVMDEGGQASHAVIVSRELGIPCAVAVTDATLHIPDGSTVTVDGGTGTVTVH
ncbi:PEP-utilizing enzyme [Georgenia ruanii]|uniref:PEP-utilising enzyme mobile domain-containing protein n=1 Tax=Georgenia ruanii TaxID=348442 RepID=A0A7J9UV99_9MICO|nr:PEP-utilizing enzyme [Georgenia ruanii]MPV88528.1 hypothetical protein [Georgenia ruanii]